MLARVLCLAATAAAASGKGPVQNMNGGGPYLIANGLDGPHKYSTDYATKNAEYFDVWAGPISTRYGEVFWQGLPAVQLPADIVSRFDNKTIAVIGYEQDQVIINGDGSGKPGDHPEKDKPVPIYWAYNHHYVAWLKGKHAEMVQLDGSDSSITGHPLQQMAFTDPATDPNPDSNIPSSQFFSEGNGGESRKSYHGYPKGYAQLLESPTEFTITPMQIDTWNRNTSYGDPFVPGPESKRVLSNAPQKGPDAIYSGHLECPCTDRVTKTVEHTYATQSTGTCPAKVGSADACFGAARTLGANAAAAASLAQLNREHATVRDPACDNRLAFNLKGTQCNGMKAAPASAGASLEACRAYCCANAKTCDTYLYGGGGQVKTGCWVQQGACRAYPQPMKGTSWSGGTSVAPPKPHTVHNVTVSSADLPAGCSMQSNQTDNSVTVYWNTNADSKHQCGATRPGVPVVLSGQVKSIVTFGLTLAPQASDASKQVTITLTGPASVWFGVGFGAQQMKDSPNAIIVLGNGTVFEQKLENQAAGSRMPTSVTVVSNTVTGSTRTVVLTRALKGQTAAHYTFDPSKGTVDFINAIGKTGAFAYHASKAASTLDLQAQNAPTCVCDTGAKGYISTDMNPNKQQFSKNCLPEPEADLVKLKNPSCTLSQYQGGLHCCKSGNILLDKDQNPWPDNKLVYYMKWRFWFQDYVPADPKASPPKPLASHQNLVRFFRETEAHSGEYDVIKGQNNVDPDKTIYQITSHFQTHEGVAQCNPRTSPHCGGLLPDGKTDKSGITLMYSSCHCHAPSCIKCELWNRDTNELICAQYPHYGQSKAASSDNPYDELGYVAIPPCLYSHDPTEGLPKPHFLAYNANLTSIKWNNNTYDHYGEMAMWQMRGYQSYVP